MVTYTQPPESLGAITSMPYDAVLPATSACTTCKYFASCMRNANTPPSRIRQAICRSRESYLPYFLRPVHRPLLLSLPVRVCPQTRTLRQRRARARAPRFPSPPRPSHAFRQPREARRPRAQPPMPPLLRAQALLAGLSSSASSSVLPRSFSRSLPAFNPLGLSSCLLVLTGTLT